MSCALRSQTHGWGARRDGERKAEHYVELDNLLLLAGVGRVQLSGSGCVT